MKGIPFLMVAGLCLIRTPSSDAQDVVNIGSRLELLVDDYLVDHLATGARFVLHHPRPQEVVMDYDEPWEGSGCGYQAVFRDGDLIRMYYKAWQLTVRKGKLEQPHPCYGAYAESRDGIHWVKPDLGIFEYKGSKHNNLVWVEDGGHDFTPFKDTNPDCPPEAKYKAVANGKGGLLAFQSPDGVHWSRMNDGKPIITKGAFDSENLAFWDSVRKQYREYHRGFRDGRRDIMTATSTDFIHWTEPVWLDYPGAPKEQLYTNQIAPYYRAPHLFIGFPTRYVERGWSDSMRALPELPHREQRAAVSLRYGTALTEGLFMTSRDGRTFKRWGEAFLRPGIQRPGQWKYGDNYLAWQVIETKSAFAGAPNELSLYATEGYWTGTTSQLRRYTLRIDGFVSIQAPLSGGEFVTKPLQFEGKELVVNFSTSAAGSLRVEIQRTDGTPVPGFSLAECPDVFGDDLQRVVTWKHGGDVSRLAGQPVRLRFVLKDADLYSLRFR